jgi:SP family general alpha glucoside:H+ symporter-like MFS transporter
MAASTDGNTNEAATAVAMDEKYAREQDQIAKAADSLVNRARAATEKEHNMTLRQGIKLYPKAIFWSMLISTCIVMEGYDVCLINNFCACPDFPLPCAVMRI